MFLMLFSNDIWRCSCYLHNDVVDGNVDEFDKEANESHDGKTDSCGHGNFLEFCENAKQPIKPLTFYNLWLYFK